MSTPDSSEPASLRVDRLMLHDLVNHLSIAMGHSDLLLLEQDSAAPAHASLTEIRESCRRAVDLVESWRAHLPPGE